MKTLLIATNQAERYMDRMAVRPLPIGLAYLAAYIDEERHDLRVLDLMFPGTPPQMLTPQSGTSVRRWSAFRSATWITRAS